MLNKEDLVKLFNSVTESPPGDYRAYFQLKNEQIIASWDATDNKFFYETLNGYLNTLQAKENNHNVSFLKAFSKYYANSGESNENILAIMNIAIQEKHVPCLILSMFINAKHDEIIQLAQNSSEPFIIEMILEYFQQQPQIFQYNYLLDKLQEPKLITSLELQKQAFLLKNDVDKALENIHALVSITKEDPKYLSMYIECAWSKNPQDLTNAYQKQKLSFYYIQKIIFSSTAPSHIIESMKNLYTQKFSDFFNEKVCDDLIFIDTCNNYNISKVAIPGSASIPSIFKPKSFFSGIVEITDVNKEPHPKLKEKHKEYFAQNKKVVSYISFVEHCNNALKNNEISGKEISALINELVDKDILPFCMIPMKTYHAHKIAAELLENLITFAFSKKVYEIFISAFRDPRHVCTDTAARLQLVCMQTLLSNITASSHSSSKMKKITLRAIAHGIISYAIFEDNQKEYHEKYPDFDDVSRLLSQLFSSLLKQSFSDTSLFELSKALSKKPMFEFKLALELEKIACDEFVGSKIPADNKLVFCNLLNKNYRTQVKFDAIAGLVHKHKKQAKKIKTLEKKIELYDTKFSMFEERLNLIADKKIERDSDAGILEGKSLNRLEIK